MTKNQKTSQEIVEKARAALAKAESNRAREIAKDSPVILALSEVLESINGDINVNSRLLNGPNSFDNRRNASERRATWIRAQEALVEAQDDLLRRKKIALADHIDALAERVANGDTDLPTANEVKNELPQCDFAQLVENEYYAKNAWKDSTPAAITARMKLSKLAQKVEDDSEASA